MNILNLSTDQLEKLYLEYFNNFQTLEGFARFYNIGKIHAIYIIGQGRIINNNKI